MPVRLHSSHAKRLPTAAHAHITCDQPRPDRVIARAMRGYRRISRWVPVTHRGRLAARPPDTATSSKPPADLPALSSSRPEVRGAVSGQLA